MATYSPSMRGIATTTAELSGAVSRGVVMRARARTTAQSNPGVSRAVNMAANGHSAAKLLAELNRGILTPMRGVAKSSATLSAGNSKLVPMRGAAKSSAKLHICTAGYGLQVMDAIQAVYSVWGAVCRDGDCKSDVGEEAVNCINAAFQRLAASGKFHVFIDRVTRSQLLSGTDFIWTQFNIALNSDIQSVESPVFVNRYLQGNSGPDAIMIGRWELRPLSDLASFEAFNQEYYVSKDAPQQPLGYFVTITREEVRSNTSGVTIPAGQKVIRLAPYPWINSAQGAELEEDWKLQYDAILKPRRFSCQTPYERLPIPHSYAETILLPLAKYFALSSRFFKGNAELKDAIMQQAADVLTQIGETDPKPKEATK